MAMVGAKECIVFIPMMRKALYDCLTIIQHMSTHPTSVLQLVSDYPHYVGYTDAYKLGVGGVWTLGLKPLCPVVWQVEWSEEINQHLITPTNKNGDITMNDLEMAGMLLGWLVLELLMPTL
eukprot:15363100-Ditylum_brightwellii.AAC.2